jgi:hypothetical protein
VEGDRHEDRNRRLGSETEWQKEANQANDQGEKGLVI